ncbi:MAG: hypothetical protein CL424_01250 [Acidimicrobiaceae bacterium]|nr:hypothetical protein [Acidimicrobiaceae bacterium]
MPAGLTTSFAVSIAENELPRQVSDLIRRVTVERSWSAADRAIIEFDGDDLAFPGKVTDQLSVDLVRDGATKSPALFDGIVVGVRLRWNAGRARVVVEALDGRHRLTRKIAPTTYEDVTLDTVVDRIAKIHQLTSESNLGSTRYPHFIVADSHFAVLQQIARRTGTVWTLDGTKIVFTKPDTSGAPVATVRAGGESAANDLEAIDLDLRFSPVERAAKVSVNSWDQVQGKAIIGSGTPAKVQSIGLDATELKAADAVAWAGGAFDVKDANEMAAGIGRRLRAAEVTGSGTVEANQLLIPGAVISIEGVGTEFAGKYVLSGVTHRLGDLDESATTEFRIGPDDSSLDQLLGGDARVGGRAPAGVTIGIVTETNDPTSKGRVRVKLPMISDQLQTGWIRLASLGGGKDRGIVFVPEVNDEVLVAFEHGELNRPYVIGTLWNDPGTAFQDVTKSNATQERTLVSKLGNKIRFVDIGESDKTSGVRVELGDNKTSIFLGYKEVTIQTQGRPLEIKNGQASFKMDNDDITITANNITIDAKQKLDVKSGQDTNVKAGTNAKIEASIQLGVKGGAGGATVESSGITAVKGSMVQVN